MADTSGDDATIWFCVRDGRRHGPFDRRRLVEALLVLDAPESALVWHAGLPAWVKAGEIDALRRELPPPVPMLGGPLPSPDPETIGFEPPPLPSEANGFAADGGEGAASGTSEAGSGPRAPLDAAAEAKRRHRHRHRRRDASSLRPYILPLLAFLVVLALVLWFLLRRMNEVEPGRILQQGERGSDLADRLALK
jgi:hypothetical protein